MTHSDSNASFHHFSDKVNRTREKAKDAAMTK